MTVAEMEKQVPPALLEESKRLCARAEALGIDVAAIHNRCLVRREDPMAAIAAEIGKVEGGRKRVLESAHRTLELAGVETPAQGAAPEPPPAEPAAPVIEAAQVEGTDTSTKEEIKNLCARAQALKIDGQGVLTWALAHHRDPVETLKAAIGTEEQLRRDRKILAGVIG